MFVMRVFIAAIILIFSFQSLVKADDIRDFQIEGMSVYDNLLSYDKKIGVTKENIKSKKLFFYPKSKKYAGISFKDRGNFEVFEAVQFGIDPNNFKIHSVDGKIRKPFKNNMKDCYIKMDEIFYDVRKLFPKAKVKKFEPYKHQYDKRAIVKSYYLYNEDGSATHIRCTDWPDDLKILDGLVLSVRSKEWSFFIKNEAYK